MSVAQKRNLGNAGVGASLNCDAPTGYLVSCTVAEYRQDVEGLRSLPKSDTVGR